MDRTNTLGICLLIIGLSASVCADGIDDYLLLADQGISPITLSTEKSGWLESVQLRASMDDSDETKSSYAFRLKPKSPGQVSSETTLLELSRKQAIFDYESNLNSELENRYLQLIGLSEAQHKANLLEQQKLTINSEIVIHRSAAKSADFDPLKLQRSELQAEGINLKIVRSQQLIQQLRGDISDSAQEISSIDINFSTTDIKNNIKKLTHSAVAQYSESILLKIKIAQANLEREKSRQNFGIDFLQLESTDREGNKNPQNYEVSIGINLPFGNQYKRSKSLDTLQRIKRKTKLSTIKAIQTEQQLKSYIELKLGEQESIQKLMDNISNRLENLRHMNRKILLIELKNEHNKYALELNNVNHSLYRSYIKLLSFYGQLAKPPIRNWLQHGAPVLARK